MSTTYRPSAPSISPVVFRNVRRKLNEQFKLSHALTQFERLNNFNIKSFPRDLLKVLENFNKNVRASGNSRNAAAAAAFNRALKAAPRVQRILNSRVRAIRGARAVVMPNGNYMMAIPTMGPPRRSSLQRPARR